MLSVIMKSFLICSIYKQIYVFFTHNRKTITFGTQIDSPPLYFMKSFAKSYKELSVST